MSSVDIRPPRRNFIALVLLMLTISLFDEQNVLRRSSDVCSLVRLFEHIARSSAYISTAMSLSVIKVAGRSEVNSEKSNGDKHSPCGTPLSCFIGSLTQSPTLTRIKFSRRSAKRALANLSDIPRVTSFCKSRVLSILSKAFVKSTYTTYSGTLALAEKASFEQDYLAQKWLFELGLWSG